ncbi:MAG: hypothetical protein IPO77_14490 [Acidobacteria bacterium]|nr:hypothetical protein [Acidobacteriota bacterium]
MMKALKNLVLILMMSLMLSLTGVAQGQNLYQGGKPPEKPKERDKPQPPPDREKRDNPPRDDKDKKDRKKPDL